MPLVKLNRWFGSNLLWVISLTITLGLLLVYQSTAARGLTWRNDGSDGGDLTGAAAVSGVAHPGGYPTYLILARIFLVLPIGALAYRTTLLSVVAAIASATLCSLIVLRSSASRLSHARVGGVLAAFALGLAPLFWSQAIITEVYTLHALFITGLTYLAVLILSATSDRRAGLVRAGGLLLGVSLGNHLTTLLFIPAWFGVLYWCERKINLRLWLESSLCLLVGLLVYAYVPLQASQHPPINWGNAADWDGFWWLVSGRGYRGLVFGLPTDLLVTRLQAWAGLIIAQFSWPGLMLALYGLFFAPTVTAASKALTVWLMVVYSIFAIGYGTSDSSAYLLPAVIALAIWLGWGIATGLDSLTGRWSALRSVALAVVVAALFGNAVHHLPEVDASRDSTAEDYAQAILSQAPPNAILITSKDRDTFSIWYYHYALRQRPDLVVLVEPLLQFQWYLANMAYTYPDLVVPDAAKISTADVIALNDRPACRTLLDSAILLDCTLSP
jgi:hypothetical protein